jgi:hypothetical protein
MGAWDTVAWVIIVLSLAWPVLYFGGALVTVVRRLFR